MLFSSPFLMQTAKCVKLKYSILMFASQEMPLFRSYAILRYMISHLFEFLTKIIIWLIKSIFEMITFFLKMLFYIFRLFLTVMPVTSSIFACLYILLTVSLASGDNVIPSDFPITVNSSHLFDTIKTTLFSYLNLMSSYNGTLMYFVLVFLALILFLPMLAIFIGAGAVQLFGQYFLIAASATLD